MQGTWENGSFVLASTKDDKIARLEATISRLREYARHKPECIWQRRHDGACDCGYDILLAALADDGVIKNAP